MVELQSTIKVNSQPLEKGWKDKLKNASGWRMRGSIIAVKNGMIFARIPAVACGDTCLVRKRDGTNLAAHVVSFYDGVVTLAPLGTLAGIFPGAQIEASPQEFSITIPKDPRGLVVNCFGDCLRSFQSEEQKNQTIVQIPIENSPPNIFSKKLLSEVFPTGVKSIDSLCTVARGQRIGLFAEAGVGKSTLLGMIARWADVDAIVIGLVGERGREVNEFLDECLGDTKHKTVVVVATSDEPAACRALAPLTSTAIAEHLRDQGMNVLLLCDSLTRMARAQREIGMASGELPVQKGYPPSVFGKLPQLLERAGLNEKGSITAFYTVLVESERIESDPLGEEIKSLLDGHISLSSRIAESGVRPAVDASRSLSRVFDRVTDNEHFKNAKKLRCLLSRLERDKDIVLLGGTPDKELAEALKKEEQMKAFLTQSQTEKTDFFDIKKLLQNVLKD
jgi:FliI/YscN family ATPase